MPDKTTRPSAVHCRCTTAAIEAQRERRERHRLRTVDRCREAEPGVGERGREARADREATAYHEAMNNVPLVARVVVKRYLERHSSPLRMPATDWNDIEEARVAMMAAEKRLVDNANAYVVLPAGTEFSWAPSNGDPELHLGKVSVDADGSRRTGIILAPDLPRDGQSILVHNAGPYPIVITQEPTAIIVRRADQPELTDDEKAALGHAVVAATARERYASKARAEAVEAIGLARDIGAGTHIDGEIVPAVPEGVIPSGPAAGDRGVERQQAAAKRAAKVWQPRQCAHHTQVGKWTPGTTGGGHWVCTCGEQLTPAHLAAMGLVDAHWRRRHGHHPLRVALVLHALRMSAAQAREVLAIAERPVPDLAHAIARVAMVVAECMRDNDGRTPAQCEGVTT